MTDRCGSALSQEALEISTRQQLEHDEAWMPLEADSDEVYDVRVHELGHDHRLHEKVLLSLLRGQLSQRLRGAKQVVKSGRVVQFPLANTRVINCTMTYSSSYHITQ